MQETVLSFVALEREAAVNLEREGASDVCQTGEVQRDEGRGEGERRIIMESSEPVIFSRDETSSLMAEEDTASESNVTTTTTRRRPHFISNHVKKRVRSEYYRIRHNKRLERADVVKSAFSANYRYLQKLNSLATHPKLPVTYDPPVEESTPPDAFYIKKVRVLFCLKALFLTIINNSISYSMR